MLPEMSVYHSVVLDGELIGESDYGFSKISHQKKRTHSETRSQNLNTMSKQELC